MIVALLVGLWFGGHPSWLPSPLRSAFTSESSNDKLVNQVLGLLSKEYYRPVDTGALVNRGLTQIVASLHDPYSHYYDPSQYGSFQQLTDPHLSGIGVDVIGTRKGVKILQVYGGTPAANAGLTRGEQIVAVGSRSLAGPNPTVNGKRATKLIKGTAGTDVTITVLRGAAHALQDADPRERDRAGGQQPAADRTTAPRSAGSCSRSSRRAPAPRCAPRWRRCCTRAPRA